MSADYEIEQKELVSRTAALKQTIDTTKEQTMNTDGFLVLAKKYMEITKLNTKIIRAVGK